MCQKLSARLQFSQHILYQVTNTKDFDFGSKSSKIFALSPLSSSSSDDGEKKRHRPLPLSPLPFSHSKLEKMRTPINLSPAGIAAAYLLLVSLLAPVATGAEADLADTENTSNVIQFQQQSLRGQSNAIDDVSRNLETSQTDIPSYQDILNIFNRNANGRKKKNKKKNKRRRKNNNKENNNDDDNKRMKFEEYSGENKDLGFLWHMWYFKGIKYEQRGTDWCVMCPGDGCEKGSPVVTNHCNPNDPDMRWEYIHVKNGVGQMKTKHYSLCLEMRDEEKPNVFRLQKCDIDEEGQLFQGLRYDGKFKLHPYKRRFARLKQCMSMLHHPLAKKEHDGEEIIDQPCHKPERTQTVFWTAEFRHEVEEEIGKKNYKCFAKGNRCKECQGECHDDEDCEEGLKCFRRNGEGWRIGVEEGTHPNPWAEIPGCSGMGKYGRDYCYDPNKA